MKSLFTYHKKGQALSDLPTTIITLVLAGLFLIFGIVILQKIRDTDAVDGGGLDYNESAWQAANKTVVGLGTFGDFWEIIVLAIVIAVVIGLLLVVFGSSSRSR